MADVKELFDNEELVANIAEDIEELPEVSKVFYAVWAVGYDKNDDTTEDDHLIGEFDTLPEAITCADKVNLQDENIIAEDATIYYSIEVDTFVTNPKDSDCCVAYMDTIYHRDIWIDGTEGEVIPNEIDPII